MPSFVGFVQLSLCSARVPCVPRRLQGPQGMGSFEGIDFLSFSLGTFLRLSLPCLFCLPSSPFRWGGPPSIRPKSGWNSLSPVVVFRHQAK